MRARWLFLATLVLWVSSSAEAQQWFSVQTEHLISYSDGNDGGAREAALRSERQIAAFGAIFHKKEIRFSTPIRVLASQTLRRDNALVRTPAANFITADLASPESWQRAARAIAILTLEDNYPRAQPWFDSGIVNYLSGTRFNADQMELGALPPGLVLPKPAEWIPMEKIFTTADSSGLPPAQREIFEAESWAAMRWIIENSRLAQAGLYLDAVQSKGSSPERALADAFSMSFGDLDREIRESAEKITPRAMPAPRVENGLFKSQKVPAVDSTVLKANLTLFGPEADRTLKNLVTLMRENQENVAVHRALAWAFLVRQDLDNAVEHIRRALALDDSDPGMHYLYARWVNQGDDDKIRILSAEPRMGTELKAALQRDPGYAPALELLGLAQLSGDSVKPALASLQRATTLCPRNSRYYLNLARAYEAAGNSENARNLLLYARGGTDAAVTADAGRMLTELGKQQKRQQVWQSMGLNADPNAKHTKYDNLQDAIEEDEKTEAKGRSTDTAQDMRKVEYLKGQIVRVECSASPGATLVVSSSGQTWKMMVADRENTVLLGAERFDCGWHNMQVAINFKRGGKFEGEIVSLEVK